MPSYLYGLILSANASGVPSGVVGIDAAPVRVVDCGVVSALASDARRDVDRTSLADVQAHDAALRAVSDAGVTVAASRFGQQLASDAALADAVRDSGDRVRRLLEQFDGAVEMRLLLAGDAAALDEPRSPPAAAPASSGPGTAYLRDVASRNAPPPVSLRAAFGPVVLAERAEYLPERRGVAIAHLVQRASLPDYREAVQSIPSLSDARVVGPLPLYSFADPRRD